jgi:NADPH:quinone reductase-like Zn-dependent oxidoreductase
MMETTVQGSGASNLTQHTLNKYTMKAARYHHYGSADVLKLEDVENLTPREGEVLIKVHSAALNAADWHLMRGTPFPIRLMSGMRTPKLQILGADVAGHVEAIGKNVTQFKPGDQVFGDLSGCGFGTFAEYVCAKENAVAVKPSKLSFEEAAAVPMSAVTALQALRDTGRISSGQKVLINGASGGVGTFAIQIAKSFGAEVTAVCSTTKMDIALSLGADHVIDYTQEDFSKNGNRYDLILAANGYRPVSIYKRALNPKGVYVTTGGSGWQLFEAMVLGPLMPGRRMTNHLATANPTDLASLIPLLEAGKITPVIDKRFPLSELPEAMRYLEKGHASGKVVINIVAA